MNTLIKNDKNYKSWIEDVGDRFKRSQIRAHVKVNNEVLRFYWTLGRDMDALKDKYSWGSKFYEIISEDLRNALPDVKSFSPRNLLYMHQFYSLFSETTKQIVSQFEDNPEIFMIPWGHIIQILNKCKDLDKVEAQYALESSSQPLGVSSYELTRLIPDDFKGSMPTIEEIEAELSE